MEDQVKAFRSKYPTVHEYISRFAHPDSPKEWILFEGVNPLKEKEIWEAHGLRFEKGLVYKVSPEVFEYIKVMKGFKPVRGIVNILTDFIKVEKPQVQEPKMDENIPYVKELNFEPRKRGRPKKVI